MDFGSDFEFAGSLYESPLEFKRWDLPELRKSISASGALTRCGGEA